jgi:MFS family permease
MKNLFKSNVFYIGLLSFFGGISQDIFVPILPIYLTETLGMDKSFVGVSAGLVIAAASIFKIISGYLSDDFKKKPIIFVGYFLSMIGRAGLVLVSSGAGILGLRFLDGAGKGIKDAPKDALIANSTEKENRGLNFGIARALDTFGSVVGPLLLAWLLIIFSGSIFKYHVILFLSAIPIIFTLLILVLKVKEDKVVKKEKISFAGKLPLPYYLFLGVMVIFSLGNSSDAFLILRASNLGLSIIAIPIAYALFNFTYALSSIPLGSLSDKIGREKVIILGWIAYTLSYLGFAFATSSWQVWFIFAFYGLYYATTEGVAKAYIADMVPVENRGKAYGLYNAAIGLVALPANIIAGLLWDKVSPATPFFFGAIVSGFSVILLIILISKRVLKKEHAN